MGVDGICKISYKVSVTPVPTKPLIVIVGLVAATLAQYLLANASRSVTANAVPDASVTDSQVVLANVPAATPTANVPIAPGTPSVSTPPVQAQALAPLPSANGYTASNGQMYHNGQRIILHGVNWSGMESSGNSPDGLWQLSMDSLLTSMQSIGVNAVRLPLCPATIDGASVSNINTQQNPDLVNKNSLQVLDALMAKLDARGMYALLDLHRQDCYPASNPISELWYTAGYSESHWLNNLTALASRYRGNSHLIGIDLKNEPHGSATWGTGNAATDWNSAAERAGQRMLGTNPALLAFVEGVAENPVCSSLGNHFWGGNLEPANCTQLQLPKNKVVFAPHVYGPDVYSMPVFASSSFPSNMPAIWDQQFGNQERSNTVVPGEWGGKYGTSGGNGNALASDKVWQDAFVIYLSQHNICSSFYWTWNPNSGDTGGVLQDNWVSTWGSKVALLQKYWNSPQCR